MGKYMGAQTGLVTQGPCEGMSWMEVRCAKETQQAKSLANLKCKYSPGLRLLADILSCPQGTKEIFQL